MSKSKNNEIIIAPEDGTEVHVSKSYGIGIDCHSKFIQVSVLVKRDMRCFEYQHAFGTDWDSLVRARTWAITVVRTCSIPAVDPDLSPLHYCIESTSTYHMPILLAWEGAPSIVNPVLAGASKRKTDVLDAKLLAWHDLTGLWKESYLPSVDVKELRVLISSRRRYIYEATAASCRINNIIVRFGLTIGRDGSVVKNSVIRSIIEDRISDNPSDMEGLCPFPIPDDVRTVVKDEYSKHDFANSRSEDLMDMVLNKALSMSWETASGTLDGPEMIRILTTAPQVGTVTAVTWLAHIITPRRFANSKAVAAYCGLDPSLKISAGHVTSTIKRGGCRELHKVLTSSADRLIRNHNEMFGRWGYNLYCQTGKWKKAANAVARKLAVALYYMMLTGQEFSYEKYNLVKDIATLDIPVSVLPSLNPDFRRYVRILESNGIQTSQQMATAYLSCELGSVHGLGKKFFMTIRDFLDHQTKYKELYKQLQKGGNQNES